MARMLQDIVTLLNRLIQFDQDAIEACKSAMDRLSDADKEELAGALADHRRHVEDLATVVRNLGGEPANRADVRVAQSKGRIATKGSSSAPRALLEAMHASEKDARAAYESAISQPGVPVDVLLALERNLDHERDHVRVVTRLLQSAKT
ncbi:MAG: DUF2383 domain-containing protein [Polyangiaceae bacterium]|jgi:uncharacterized protein (TIGR02284 family)